MRSLHRILRFRLPGDNAPAWIHGRIQIEVRVDEAITPAGYIVELPADHGAPRRWSYVSTDGQATGLQSVLSRRDLEAKVQDHYFVEMPSDYRQSA